jgi:hypothetical protein
MNGFKKGLLIVNAIVAVVLVVWLVVWGLSKLAPAPLTNKQIIDQTNYCKKQGFKAEIFVIALTGETSKIECRL